MGPSASRQYRNDPRRLLFVLARYKYCAKLLSGCGNVLEVGCGEAFGTPLVAQEVNSILAIDWDPDIIEGNVQRLAFLNKCTFQQQDVVEEAPTSQFDGVYSVDVIEHIDPDVEEVFMRNTCSGLKDDGIYIMGTPNVKSEQYASKSSALSHINLKDAVGLRELLSRYMKNVFIFSMNDEVVHTGFYDMAHYLFAVGVGVRRG